MGTHIVECSNPELLPFARSQIARLRAAGLRFGTHTYDVQGVIVRIRLVDANDYIEVSGNSVDYEFFTSGPTLETLDVDDLPFARGYAVKVSIRSAAKATASGSTVEPPPEDGESIWEYSADPDYMNLFMPHQQIWQLQGIPEHIHFPDQKSDPVLVSMWGASSNTIGAGLDGVGGDRGQFDVLFDVSPSIFPKKERTPVQLAPDSDWYRRAGMQTVVDNIFGTRKFIILTDVSGFFNVFPINAPRDDTLAGASAYVSQFIKTNIGDTYNKAIFPPYPSWVLLPPEDKARDTAATNAGKVAEEYPQYVWAFNSTSTRACAVVLERLPPAPLYNNSTNVPTGDYLTRGSADLTAGRTPVRPKYPGLLEFDISIALTGPNPEDFDVSVTVRRDIRPTVAKKAFVAADYGWETKAVKSPGVAKDDLITMRIASALNSGVVVENATQSTTLRTFGVIPQPSIFSTTRFNNTRLIAYDLRAMAFAIQDSAFIISVPSPVNGSGPGSGDEDGRKVIKRGDRLRVIMHNTVQVTQDLTADGDLKTLLTEIQDLPIEENLYMNLVTWVGDANLTGPSDYRATGYEGVLDAGSFSPRLRADLPLLAGYLIGRIDSVISTAFHERFTVHPDGHWAIATRPIAYLAGWCRAGGLGLYGNGAWSDGTYAGALSPRDQIPDPTLEQDFLDIISVRVNGVDKRTTHLESFNKAYRKGREPVKKENFFYSASSKSTTYTDAFGRTVVRYYMEITPNSTPSLKAGVFLYDSTAGGVPYGGVLRLGYGAAQATDFRAIFGISLGGNEDMEFSFECGLISLDPDSTFFEGGTTFVSPRAMNDRWESKTPFLKGSAFFGR